MEETFVNNSNAAKEAEAAETKREAVAQGHVKKSFGAKLMGALLNQDITDIKDYFLFDVLIPVFKQAGAEAITRGVNDIFGTNVRPGGGSTGRVQGAKVEYHRAGDSNVPKRREERSASDYADIVVSTRYEAESVLDRMSEIVEAYQAVSIFDLYEACDITPPYTSKKYGWTSMEGMSVVKVQDGYLIKVPKAHLL